MNRAARELFDSWYIQEYFDLVINIETKHPGHGLRRARSSTANAYRFWSKVEADGNPTNWILREADGLRQTRTNTGISPNQSETSESATSEKSKIARPALQRQMTARAVLTVVTAVALGAELLATRQ